jgi:hypothetical protein
MNILREHSLVSAVWCDDIREEVGNKLSFMGVYNQVVVASIPSVIPRLAAHMTVFTPIARPVKKLAFKILKSDEDKELASGEFQFPAPDPAAATVAEDMSVNIYTIGVLLGNISVGESTRWLRAEVDTGEERLTSLKLRIVRPEQ